MAKDLNKVLIIGRLVNDPDMRYTPSGNPVTTFRVATTRQWKDGSGESHEETEWFSIVTWNKLAEICRQFLGRGTRVYLEGRLQTRSWEDQQSGQTRTKIEIVAHDMIILETRDHRQHRDNHAVADDEYTPRDGGRAAERGGSYPPPAPDIGDEDIPF